MRRPLFNAKGTGFSDWGNEPAITFLKKSNEFKLEKDFTFTVAFPGRFYTFTVRKGFVFDGASIPRPFKNIIGGNLDDQYRTPALIHDFLYAAEIFDRRTLDLIFLQGMKDAGVAFWKRWTMYFAVRIGGGCVWKGHCEAGIREVRRLCQIEIFRRGKPPKTLYPT